MDDRVSGLNPDEMLRMAAALIQHEQHVSEMTAFSMLVQAAVDGRTSVREAASRVVTDARVAT
jgi:AmiR/NasT family two-component response regulator